MPVAPGIVAVPPGATPLADIGVYRVFYQSYGGNPIDMPLSWAGHFDETTGISYQPWTPVLGRPALLLHSPWRVPPGRTAVEYRLHLPPVTPLALEFGIAIGPDVAQPDKSDGVTFVCALVASGVEKELMRQHWDRPAWRDYSLDLSAHAGRVVTVRLQVEPGPRNNPAFDYSFFGAPRIVADLTAAPPLNPAARFVATPAYRAVAGASLLPLANTPFDGVVPSNLLPAQTRTERVRPPENAGRSSTDRWRFVYRGPDCEVVYLYSPSTGTLDDFTVQVDGGPPFQPALGGGATALPDVDDASPTNRPPPLPVAARGGRPLRIDRIGDRLDVLWEYPFTNPPLHIDWKFRLAGKAIVVSAHASSPTITGFSLGQVAAPIRRPIDIPYLPGIVHYLPVENLFAARWLDWTAGNASTCPQGSATYDSLTDGSRNLLAETGYITVSPEIDEVLPNLPHPPSPFLATLAPNIMLDIWDHHDGGFAGDAARLRALKDVGVDHLVIIQHVWQRYGYDVKLPDHLPADPNFGGEEGLHRFSEAARDAGFLWALHENYIDLYPDAPSYNADDRVLRADGSPSPAWYNPGTRVQSFGLKCNRALDFARQNSPEAHRRYGTTAAYLDVHTCVPPWHQLDHQAGQPLAGMARAKVQFDSALFRFERETHAGPLFGEGANHCYWAGRCDGVEAQVAGGEDHVPFLDFDLLKLHPQMVNHGLGYYERWFRRGYEAQWGADAGSVAQLDKYRAMELAYGHAGFLGARLVHNLQAVAREHHLVHPVQRLYANARATEIRYEVAGQFVTGSAALAAGETWRQRIRYDSGLTLWVNWRAEPWTLNPDPATLDAARAGGVPTESAAARPVLPLPMALRSPGANPRTFVLPQWGWLAVGPATCAATCLEGSNVVDYAECPEFVYADARTTFDLPYVQPRKNIEPQLKEFLHLGGTRIRVTYQWIVGEAPGAEYRCFVHAINPNSPGNDRIVFQGDHALAKPTRLWQPGDIILDGPHDLVVSPDYDEYDLAIGLFQNDRARLRGRPAGGNRIWIARLKTTKTGGQVSAVALEPPPASSSTPVEPEADFSAHTNPSGTWTTSGPVTTDSAAKVNRHPDRLVVFPWPRDRAVRLRLDLKALAPQADLGQIRIRALEAETQRDLGSVPFALESGTLCFTAQFPKAGRYTIAWTP